MRSPAEGNPYPYASHSCWYQPAPIPISTRPPEIMSTVEAVLANSAGLR